jgi:hypothetical protein
MKWYRETLAAADRVFKKIHDVPLAMVAIDPLIDAYGAEKENSSEEANEAKKAFRTLSKEFDNLFWINDHMGKDPERGSRGTSAKPDSADFIFSLPERVADISEPRTMWVKKLRTIPGSGSFGVSFTLKPMEIEAKDGKIHSNLVVWCWGDEVRRGDGATKTAWSPKKTGRPPRKPSLALDALAEMITERSPKAGSKTVTWIPLDDMCDKRMERPTREGKFQTTKDGGAGRLLIVQVKITQG